MAITAELISEGFGLSNPFIWKTKRYRSALGSRGRIRHGFDLLKKSFFMVFASSRESLFQY
jgi:hypothetical protein